MEAFLSTLLAFQPTQNDKEMIQILPVDVDEKLYFLNIWDTVSCSSLRKEKKKKKRSKNLG